MNNTTSTELVPVTQNLIPLQDASLGMWNSKYRLRDRYGTPVDQTIEDTFKRVAKALSDVEENEELRTHWYSRFLWALENGALPAGRILANAGAGDHKPATSTINCTVSATIEDSMDDILKKNHLAGLTLQAGCGIGYDFSTLRPKGAFVTGAGAKTSGPLSFMDIFDKMCSTIASAGGRRGAQMATFDVCHPDVVEFIKAKREDGRLRQFNLSLLITSEFIEAVNNDSQWRLSFPITVKEAAKTGLNVLEHPELTVWREFPHGDGHDYFVNDEGKVACKIYETIQAKELWDLIMESTYEFAEPGFILIDKVNEMNNNWFAEYIRATNPCGEQPLPPNGSCLLGSINLTHFVENPFTPQASFNWGKYHEVIRIFTRMLDNVVEINGLPLVAQCEEIFRKRRHGMGFLASGSAMTMLGMAYGDEESVAFIDEVSRDLALKGWETALELAKEKGPAPLLAETFTVTTQMLSKRPEMAEDGYKVGDEVKGAVLHAKYSRYMQTIAEVAPDLVDELSEIGARFTHHTSIAPTGTISLSLGNNVSNGIEPSFAHKYSRNIIKEGRKTKKQVDVCSYELLAYRMLVNPDADPYAEDPANQLPAHFVTSEQVTPKQHVDIQAAAQKWIDSSISKTANVPSDFPYDDFKGIYMYGYEQGLKGCTTFRPNPEVNQGVLIKYEDMENTTYVFTLEDGSDVKFKGSDEVVYEGETHTATNLFEAIKEGLFGKF